MLIKNVEKGYSQSQRVRENSTKDYHLLNFPLEISKLTNVIKISIFMIWRGHNIYTATKRNRRLKARQQNIQLTHSMTFRLIQFGDVNTKIGH